MRFLEEIASYIKANYSNHKKLKVILPSQRAKRYLQKELYLSYKKPIISPDIYTIDEWIKQYYPNTIDHTQSLLQLFKIHQKINSKQESFEEFLQWGPTLLSDFDDIDKYLIDNKEVFKNLKSIKELEAWQMDKPLSPNQSKFFEFWEKLDVYYNEFHKSLEKEKKLTVARAYREMAQNIQNLNDNFYLFIGFNALSESELTIIRKLRGKGMAEYIVDADKYYLNDHLHEGGMFIRKAMNDLQLSNTKFIKDKLGNKELAIKIFESPQYTGQIKIASDLLAKMNQETLNETALILADESLINGVIQNLPKTIQKANITLGTPLQHTPVKSWVEILFTIQENKKKFKTNSIYYLDLLKLMQHVFFQSCVRKKDLKTISDVELQTVSRNKIFQSANSINLPKYLHDIVHLIYIDWGENWEFGIKQLRAVNNKILELIQRTDEYELSCIMSFENRLISFQKIIEEGLPKMTLSSFKNIFNQHWKKEQLSYEGTFTNGLQIMGILETRLLDFKNIIMIGLNEGNLPSNNPIDSIIPLDLRIARGMPSTRQKQGVFAHHFYRLLHNVENLVCTYASSSDSLSNNEKSRFLLQIEYELAIENTKVNIEKYLYKINYNDPLTLTNQVVKSTFYKTKIDDFFGASVSASAINKYLACPLDFYYRYIIGFEESSEVEEQIKSHNFGTFIHSTLEKLYRPFAQYDKDGNKIVPSPGPVGRLEIDKMLIDYPKILQKEYLAYFQNDKRLFQKGMNKLSLEMASLSVKKFLVAEREFVVNLNKPLFIEYLENSMNAEVSFSYKNQNKTIFLKGIIDRIDRYDDKYRIIDYKSGKASLKDVTFNKTSKSTKKSVFVNATHVLQLAFYAIMFEQKFGRFPSQTIIKSLLNPKKNYNLENANGSIQEVIESLSDLLGEIYEELLDDQISIEHNTKSLYCQFCE